MDDTNITQLGMLFEYLEGLTGSEFEQEHVIGEISRVFFVGNSFGTTGEDANAVASSSSSAQSEKFVKVAEVAKKLDTLISQLAVSPFSQGCGLFSA